MSLAFYYLILVGKIDLGSVRLNFWDLGGQEELQSLWDKVRTHSTSDLGGNKWGRLDSRVDFLFVLWFNVTVYSYGHVETVT